MTNLLLSHTSDVELFVKYQTSQDAAALGELYQRYYPKVFSYTFTILKDREEAYDLTEETFLILAEKAQSLRNPQLFTAWLFRIARNGCLDCKKSKQRFYYNDLNQVAELADEAFDYEAATSHEALLVQLNGWLDKMPVDARELLIARYLQNKSISQLQTEYQLSESAVKMRLLRARDKMMECYQQARA